MLDPQTPAADLVVDTAVGIHIGTENYLRGYAVGAELVGNDGFWSCLSLSVGGRRLDRDEEGMLDDLSTASNATESRVWPLKLTRVLASYGGAVAALGAAQGALPGCMTGPAPIKTAAAFLTALADAVGTLPDDPDTLTARVRATLLPQLAARGPVGGFGVFSREHDERLLAITRRVQARGRAEGRHWRLMLAAQTVVHQAKGVRANCAAGIAAVGLDLGYRPDQLEILALAVLWPSFAAIAHEGAAQASAVLRELPTHAITYVGQAARESLAKAAETRAARRSLTDAP